MHDMPSIQNTIKNYYFKTRELTELVNNYNILSGSSMPPEVLYKKDRISVRPGIFVGTLALPMDYTPLRTGIMVNFKSSNPSTRVQYNTGLTYMNNQRYWEHEPGKDITIELPVYASYSVLYHRTINWSIDLGAIFCLQTGMMEYLRTWP